VPLEEMRSSEQAIGARHVPERRCVGCGRADDARAMVRFVLIDEKVVVDGLFARRTRQRPGRPRGRAVHVHPRPACVGRASRGMARAWKRDGRPLATELLTQLSAACIARMNAVLEQARRANALVAGTSDATLDSVLSRAPLWIVALDAGAVATRAGVMRAVGQGRVIAWKTKRELGALVGEVSAALCGVMNDGLARELQVLRLAADGGTAMTTEGAECSSALEAR